MNILVLTNEYPNESFPKPDWTWIVPYFCRSWRRQSHNVVAINNAAAFPKIYYGIAKVFRHTVASTFGVSEKGLDETAWTKRFFFDDNGVQVFNLPMKKYIPGGKYNECEIASQVIEIVSILKSISFNPDVITGHWVNPQLKLVVELKAYYKNAKTGFVFHGDYTENKCRKFRVNYYLKKIDRIGFRNSHSLQYSSKYLDLQDKGFICPSGLPDEYYYVHRKKKDFTTAEMTVLSAGRLVDYKNFPTLIDACYVAYGDEKYTLEIAGEGPLEGTLKEKIASLNASDKIKLLGQVPRNMLQSIMLKSQVFVLISMHETFGLVYLEAMLQGCIVIASKCGGMDGIIENGINGFLCKEGDKNELISILRRIKSMPYDEKKSISDKAINTAYYYSDSKVAERYLKNLTV